MFFTEKNISIFLFTVFLIVTLFFSGIASPDGNRAAHASFLDIIRAFVTINPLTVKVSAPSEVEIGNVFKVEAKVINKGKIKIEDIKVEIFLPTGLSLQGRNAVQMINVIQGKKERKIIWPMRGEDTGNYVITVSTSGELNGDSVSAQDSKVLTVKKKAPPPGRLSFISQNLLDFIKQLLRI